MNVTRSKTCCGYCIIVDYCSSCSGRLQLPLVSLLKEVSCHHSSYHIRQEILSDRWFVASVRITVVCPASFVGWTFQVNYLHRDFMRAKSPSENIIICLSTLRFYFEFHQKTHQLFRNNDEMNTVLYVSLFLIKWKGSDHLVKIYCLSLLWSILFHLDN